jgi:hypothetical protein
MWQRLKNPPSIQEILRTYQSLPYKSGYLNAENKPFTPVGILLNNTS